MSSYKGRSLYPEEEGCCNEYEMECYSQAYLRYDSLLTWFATAHHSVALTSTSLAVGEDTHIVALESMLKHLNTDVFIDLSLAGELRIFRLITAQKQTSP